MYAMPIKTAIKIRMSVLFKVIRVRKLTERLRER